MVDVRLTEEYRFRSLGVDQVCDVLHQGWDLGSCGQAEQLADQTLALKGQRSGLLRRFGHAGELAADLLQFLKDWFH